MLLGRSALETLWIKTDRQKPGVEEDGEVISLPFRYGGTRKVPGLGDGASGRGRRRAGQRHSKGLRTGPERGCSARLPKGGVGSWSKRSSEPCGTIEACAFGAVELPKLPRNSLFARKVALRVSWIRRASLSPASRTAACKRACRVGSGNSKRAALSVPGRSKQAEPFCKTSQA